MRLTAPDWVGFTIWWPDTLTFSYFLVQQHFVDPEHLRLHPAITLFQQLGWIDVGDTKKTKTSGNIRTRQRLHRLTPTHHTIEVIFQAASLSSDYPDTWTLAATPIALALGQIVTVRENNWNGQLIGHGKIMVVYALEQSWVELGIRFTENMHHRGNHPMLHVTAPLTHVALPPTLNHLHRQLKSHLPEILALSCLPRPCPIAHVATRTKF